MRPNFDNEKRLSRSSRPFTSLACLVYFYLHHFARLTLTRCSISYLYPSCRALRLPLSVSLSPFFFSFFSSPIYLLNRSLLVRLISFALSLFLPLSLSLHILSVFPSSPPQSPRDPVVPNSSHLRPLLVSLEPRFLRILNPVANCDPTRRDRNGQITSPRAIGKQMIPDLVERSF